MVIKLITSVILSMSLSAVAYAELPGATIDDHKIATKTGTYLDELEWITIQKEKPLPNAKGIVNNGFTLQVSKDLYDRCQKAGIPIDQCTGVKFGEEKISNANDKKKQLATTMARADNAQGRVMDYIKATSHHEYMIHNFTSYSQDYEIYISICVAKTSCNLAVARPTLYANKEYQSYADFFVTFQPFTGGAFQNEAITKIIGESRSEAHGFGTVYAHG